MKRICEEISWLLDDALKMFRQRGLVLLWWPLVGSAVFHAYQYLMMSFQWTNYLVAHPTLVVFAPIPVFFIATIFFNASFLQIDSLSDNHWVNYREALGRSLAKSLSLLLTCIFYFLWHILLLFVVVIVSMVVAYVLSFVGLNVATNPLVLSLLTMLGVSYCLYFLVRSLALGEFVMQSEQNPFHTFVAYLQFSAGAYRWGMILMAVSMAYVLQLVLVGWLVALAISIESFQFGVIVSWGAQVICGGLGWTLILITISLLAKQWRQAHLVA